MYIMYIITNSSQSANKKHSNSLFQTDLFIYLLFQFTGSLLDR